LNWSCFDIWLGSVVELEEEVRVIRAVLDWTGATWFSGSLVTRSAANFSLPLYSDHDCLAFHQLTVPKVKPGPPHQRQLSR